MNAHNKYSPVTTTELRETILGQYLHESNMQLLGPAEQKVMFEALFKITWTNRLGQNNKRGAKISPLSKPEHLLALWGGGRFCQVGPFRHAWQAAGALPTVPLSRTVVTFRFPHLVLRHYKY